MDHGSTRPAEKLLGFEDELSSGKPISVLIEIRQAPVKLARSVSGRGARGITMPPQALLRVDEATSAQALYEVQAWLNRVAPAESPVVLRDARLLVATLNPAQVRALAELPQVQTIRPNRVHRQPRLA